ncbi:MAG: HD domain-containing protein, partial [Chloroflexi bacterium]|nr:HD domain-containing protein [Chloroflexota bacterium]
MESLNRVTRIYGIMVGVVGSALLVISLTESLLSPSKVFAILLVPILATFCSFFLYVRQTRGQMANLKTANEALNAMNHNLIGMLASTVDVKDSQVYGHSAKVAAYASAIAKEMALPKEEIDLIRRAGLLHDLGKIGISSDTLRKPGPLSSNEYARLKQHSKLGAEILRRMPQMRSIASLIECHHERWDGKGYPHGWSGEQSPVGARIIALADALDTMLSERLYRRASSFEWVLEEVERCRGTQFDPTVVAAFQRLVKSQGKEFFQNADVHALATVVDDLPLYEPPVEPVLAMALRTPAREEPKTDVHSASNGDNDTGKHRLTLFGLPLLLSLYIATIAGLAVIVLLVAAVTLRSSFTPQVILFALLAMAAEMMPVRISQVHSKVTVGFAVIFASALLFGPAAASVLAALASLADAVTKRQRRLEKIIFNVSILALCGYLSGSTFNLLGGSLQQISVSTLILPALAATAVYYALNIASLSAAISLASGQQVVKALLSHFDWLAASHFAMGLVGLGMALAFKSLGLLGLTIFLVPLAMSRLSLQLYLARTKEVRQKSEELERHLAEMSALHAITNALGSTLDLSGTLDLVTRAITASMGFHFGLVLTAARDGSLAIDAQRGLEEPERQNAIVLQLANVTLKGRKSVFVVGATQQDEFGAVADWRLTELGAQTITFVPLIDKGEMFGALCAGSAERPAKNELQLLQTFATEAAIAIGN